MRLVDMSPEVQRYGYGLLDRMGQLMAEYGILDVSEAATEARVAAAGARRAEVGQAVAEVKDCIARLGRLFATGEVPERA
ncbi:MAG: hypothetical protein EPO26_09915 [Chloroflexota bacterium]|nr:MAG: hypothetical protein EPO26_09915 [Chloroflexota bacterium]